jgi:hypothetical protein
LYPKISQPHGSQKDTVEKQQKTHKERKARSEKICNRPRDKK